MAGDRLYQPSTTLKLNIQVILMFISIKRKYFSHYKYQPCHLPILVGVQAKKAWEFGHRLCYCEDIDQTNQTLMPKLI